LIELLVVIAIIAILAAMLLPVLSKSKNRAYAVTDLNNCKQTLLGMLMYCSDFNDNMPAPGWTVTEDCWITAANPPAMHSHSAANFQKDFDQQRSWFTGVTAPEPGSPQPPKSSLLYIYLKNPDLFHCPQDQVNSLYLRREEIISSYVWNGATVDYKNGQAPYKITSFKPTNVLQWENDDRSVANGQCEGDYGLNLSVRHGNAVQVGRFDGSAGRENMQVVMQLVKSPKANDFWCAPGTTTGH
jgi:type II secretory pathway pseudopilin PulG